MSNQDPCAEFIQFTKPQTNDRTHPWSKPTQSVRLMHTSEYIEVLHHRINKDQGDKTVYLQGDEQRHILKYLLFCSRFEMGRVNDDTFFICSELLLLFCYQVIYVYMADKGGESRKHVYKQLINHTFELIYIYSALQGAAVELQTVRKAHSEKFKHTQKVFCLAVFVFVSVVIAIQKNSYVIYCHQLTLAFKDDANIQ